MTRVDVKVRGGLNLIVEGRPEDFEIVGIGTRIRGARSMRWIWNRLNDADLDAISTALTLS